MRQVRETDHPFGARHGVYNVNGSGVGLGPDHHHWRHHRGVMAAALSPQVLTPCRTLFARPRTSLSSRGWWGDGGGPSPKSTDPLSALTLNDLPLIPFQPPIFPSPRKLLILGEPQARVPRVRFAKRFVEVAPNFFVNKRRWF
jgi:hypothetical protein